MPLTPGDTFFEYRITRALGQGAFGTVYLAQDTLLDRPVAIKELTAAAQADRAAFQRFLQEARAAGSLNHPNIVTIYALKPADATVYLVMEYLPGGSLRALLSQRGRLPVDDAVRIAADVCDGLAAAHAKGIVHRDIKPENILLTADGRAKVGDFGIAHVPRDCRRRLRGRTDPNRISARDADLYVAGADSRGGGGWPERCLPGGRAALRDAGRPALHRCGSVDAAGAGDGRRQCLAHASAAVRFAGRGDLQTGTAGRAPRATGCA